MPNEEHREPNGHLRATRNGRKGTTHVHPQAVTEVKSPCPICHNTAYLQDDFRPEPGYDQRMRQFKCMQGHEYYTIPRHPRTVLHPPE